MTFSVYNNVKMITVTCKVCSKPFDTYAAKHRVYCSPSCQHRDPELKKLIATNTKKTVLGQIPVSRCKVCNTIINDSPCRKRVYCSSECQYKDPDWRQSVKDSNKLFNEAQKLLPVTLGTFTCEACKKEYQAPLTSRSPGRMYCSRECRHKTSTGTCIICNTNFNYDDSSHSGKYCSRKCADSDPERYKKTSERQREYYKSLGMGSTDVPCLVCKTSIRMTPGLAKTRRYCSRDCYSKDTERLKRLSDTLKGHPVSDETRYKLSLAKKGNKCPSWRGGAQAIKYPGVYTRRFRESIYNRDGYFCQNPECGNGPSLAYLTVHHIDYNKWNNDPSNVLTLCFSCNCRANYDTDHWKAYYKGWMKEFHPEYFYSMRHLNPMHYEYGTVCV